MYEEYIKLLNEIEGIFYENYSTSEVLLGYCEYLDGKNIPAFIMINFLKKLKEKQLEAIDLIDKKSTEIGHSLLS